MNLLRYIPICLALLPGVGYTQLDTSYFHPESVEFSHQVFSTSEGLVTFGMCKDPETWNSLMLIRQISGDGEILVEKTYDLDTPLLFTGYRGSVAVHENEYLWVFSIAGDRLLTRFNENLDTLWTKVIPNPWPDASFYSLDRVVVSDLEIGLLGRSNESLTQDQMIMGLDEEYEVSSFENDIVQPWGYDWMFDHDFLGDDLVLSGVIGEWNEEQEENVFSPYVGLCTVDGTQIWGHELGHPTFNDHQGASVILPNGNIAFFYVETEYITTWSGAFYGTLTRKDFSPDGEELNTWQYADSIPAARITHAAIFDDKIYVGGFKYGGYLTYYDSFMQVSDFDGTELNYVSLSHIDCATCSSDLLDFTHDTEGNVFLIGEATQDSVGGAFTQETWFSKLDCMANLHTPSLSLDFTYNVQPSGQATFSLDENNWESVDWLIDGQEYEGTEVTTEFDSSGEYEVQVFGHYCTLDLDTALTLDIDLSIVENRADWRLFPNPTSGLLTIETDLTHPSELEIFNLQGQRVFFKSDFIGTQSLDLGDLPSGHYLVQISGEMTLRRRLTLID